MPLAPKPSAIHKVEYPEYVPISNTFFGLIIFEIILKKFPELYHIALLD